MHTQTVPFALTHSRRSTPTAIVDVPFLSMPACHFSSSPLCEHFQPTYYRLSAVAADGLWRTAFRCLHLRAARVPLPLSANQSRFSEQHEALIVDQLTATSCKTNERCATTFSSLFASFLRMDQQLCERTHHFTSLFHSGSWVSQEVCLMIGTDSHSRVESKHCEC